MLRRLGSDSPVDALDAVRAAIGAAATGLGWAGDCASAVRSIPDAQAILGVALKAVMQRAHDDMLIAEEHGRLLSVLDEVRQAQVLLETTVSARRADALTYVRDAVGNLRHAGTVAELISRAPAEAARLGFERCLLSSISDSKWVTRSAYVSGDDQLADAMVDVGNRTPRVIDGRLVEYELVRERKSLLVRDPLHNGRVHPELVRLVKPVAYVVAPIIVRGRVVGFIHADTGADGDLVDEFDRDVLDTFSTGLSITLESLYYREQLDRIRQHMDRLGSLTSCLGDVEPHDVTLPSDGRGLPSSMRSMVQSTRGQLDRLTRREVEVLMHMADGETNRRIAARLFVSEATIKAHVKHILRKLDAANRAEAVSRYFRAN